MKSHLSHILPVAEACSILEEATVRRIVRSFLSCRRSPKYDPQEEILVMRALQYKEEEVPNEIQTTWNRYTKRTMGLDKLSLLKWMMPIHAGPHVGPGGHLGLFDCLVHAMSASANHHGTSSNSINVSLTPVVLLPDFLIVLAICKEYAKAASDVSLKSMEESSDDDDDDYVVMMTSVFAFRVYDSYQKKGMVSRDTLHRFLTDVYGDDSFKRPQVRAVLDQMFHKEEGGILTSISGSQFCHGIAATMGDGQVVSHILLDWLVKLVIRLIPAGELPLSTQAYLETIGSSHRSVERLCQDYGLAESSRLYEIKRRFHSMVESSNVIHGDPMSADAQESSRPRHVISEKAFVKAVSLPNSDMGHGGYLPESLAKLTFQAACFDTINKDDGGEPETEQENEDDEAESQNAPEGYWALFDVLQFGCYAVRRPVAGRKKESSDLLKFAFRVFGLLPGELAGHRVLTREQIGRMLLLLLEHATFRLGADSPPSDEDSPEEMGYIESDDLEETLIESTQAALLGLLPSDVNKSEVPLKVLIDDVLGEKETLSFDAFCSWQAQVSRRPSSQQRLGPYLNDLRMIAAILFGVPPSHASMEKKLVEEAHQRHKYRYPQTDASRRGPRGTIWYILDDRWYRSWMNHVQKVSGTDQDTVDNRDVLNAAPRGLNKINNTGLLADNGSLALRADIKWRQDYEIIPPMAWSALQAWYDGGPPISRTVVPYIPTTGAPSPHSRVPRVRTAHEIELYPFFVTVFLCDTLSHGAARPFQQYVPVSRVCPVRMLLLQLCKGMDVEPKYGRIWVMGSDPSNLDVSETTESSDWLLDLDTNIVEQLNRRGSSANLENGNSIVLLLELKDPGTDQWPRGADGKHWIRREGGAEGIVRQQTGVGDGIVGLYNMGNTCYLNSSIQCLSHTPIFRDYFTSKVYLNDINTTNPLGHEGRLAQVSAILINTLWKYNQSSALRPQRRITAPGSYIPVNAPAVTPKTFRDSLGKFNDHFAGNEQHDAQELLAFLLGGLSEDLNRIVDKPYIEAPDSDGRPDAELAEIWWENHLKREMSIIVALFTGQYKSLLTCRSCKYESARFEPFSFLQVPLPEDDKIAVSLVLYPLSDKEDPTRYSVRVRHDGNLSDVLYSLAKVLYNDSVITEEGDGAPNDVAAEKNEDEEVEEADPELEAKYREIAKNLAVVDMRDGYIFKIAPNSWMIPELQIKDTGELPLLHIYRLDPLPRRNEEETSTERVEGEERTEPSTKDNEGNNALTTDKVDTMSEDEFDDKGKSVNGVDREENGDTDSDDDSSEHPEKVVANGNDDTRNEFANLKRVNPDNESTSIVETINTKQTPDVKFSFLAFAQRRTEMSSGEMLHPFTHQVFGTPLLMRVVDLEGYTGRDLYDLVAKRIRSFVPKSALRFLTDQTDKPRDDDEKEDLVERSEDSIPMPRAGSRKRRHRTTTDMEEVAAGPVPRYGFRLRLVSRDGKKCALCPWYECCIGCLIPDDDYPTIVTCGDSIAIDWHFAVDIATSGFGIRGNQLDSPSGQAPMRTKQFVIPVKNHSSYGNGSKKKGSSGAVTLEQCLDAFAEEERIPEAYCSRCQDFRVSTKRMSLWRLPPILIIHLKRFQFTQHARRKLRDMVTFPIEGLDLSRIMASDASTSTSSNVIINGKHKEDDGTADDDSSSTDKEEELAETTTNGEDPPSNKDGNLYDLYGVVHHQGALSGGHYVASLKSEIDGQWRLFNDAQVFDIHSRDIVDSSAYILFYIRRDAKGAKLEDFWDTAAREGEGLTEEEMEKLMKGRSDRCVIS